MIGRLIHHHEVPGSDKELCQRDPGLFSAGKNARGPQSYEDMKAKVLDEVKKTFRPEFINRLDEIIVFHTLSEEQLRSIVDLLAKDLQERLLERKLTVELTDEAKDWLAKVGYDPQYGARPLRRALERYVENPLAIRVLEGEFNEGDGIVVDLDGEELTFTRKTGTAA